MGNDIKMIRDLAKIYAKYKIYPKSCFEGRSFTNKPVRLFLDSLKFYDNHYRKEIEIFLKEQKYKPTKRGADLPWWGNSYFSSKKHQRVMIIGQDSLAKDAGSVVYFAHLMENIETEEQYKKFCNSLSDKKNAKNKVNFSFSNYSKIRSQIKKWKFEFDYLYITDAAKVYHERSKHERLKRKRDFDMKKSKELLDAEITFCNPNMIVILGRAPLQVLFSDLKYASFFERKEPIQIFGVKCIVSPFISGQGPSQPHFEDRLKTATKMIRECARK
jgi:hypothetical protein